MTFMTAGLTSAERHRLSLLSVNYYELTVELSDEQEDTESNMVFVLNGELNSTDLLPGWRQETIDMF